MESRDSINEKMGDLQLKIDTLEREKRKMRILINDGTSENSSLSAKV